MKNAAIFLANGFEEIEAITIVDVLRRANITTEIVSIDDNLDVSGSHHISVRADQIISELDPSTLDIIILPGGMPGSTNLNNCKPLKKLLLEFSDKNKIIGAICAAPLVLGELGILNNRKATCYPGFEKHLKGASYSNTPVEEDGNIITGNGPGASLSFALALVKKVVDEKTAERLAKQMMVLS